MMFIIISRFLVPSLAFSFILFSLSLSLSLSPLPILAHFLLLPLADETNGQLTLQLICSTIACSFLLPLLDHGLHACLLRPRRQTIPSVSGTRCTSLLVLVVIIICFRSPQSLIVPLGLMLSLVARCPCCSPVSLSL